MQIISKLKLMSQRFIEHIFLVHRHGTLNHIRLILHRIFVFD